MKLTSTLEVKIKNRQTRKKDKNKHTTEELPVNDFKVSFEIIRISDKRITNMKYLLKRNC